MQKTNRIFTDVSQPYEHALYNDINGFSMYRCIFEDFLLSSLYQQNLCFSHALFFTTKFQDRISYQLLYNPIKQSVLSVAQPSLGSVQMLLQFFQVHHKCINVNESIGKPHVNFQ